MKMYIHHIKAQQRKMHNWAFPEYLKSLHRVRRLHSVHYLCCAQFFYNCYIITFYIYKSYKKNALALLLILLHKQKSKQKKNEKG